MDPSRRAPLPADPSRLEPMGPSFEGALEAGLRELDLWEARAGSPGARRSYELHARLLRAWGGSMNLTAIRDPAAVAVRHVCDSLSAIGAMSLAAGGPLAGRGPDAGRVPRPARSVSLLDLGSGAGYPGLPLAAAVPWDRVALVESIAKKARFLGVAADAVTGALAGEGLTPPSIAVLSERAEDLADDPGHRAAWDVVTARGIGSATEVAELGLPLLRVGGLLVVWKRDAPDRPLAAELRAAGGILRACGGGRPRVLEAGLVDLPGHRLVVVRKERPTPPAYPRAAGRRRERGRRDARRRPAPVGRRGAGAVGGRTAGEPGAEG